MSRRRQRGGRSRHLGPSAWRMHYPRTLRIKVGVCTLDDGHRPPACRGDAKLKVHSGSQVWAEVGRSDGLSGPKKSRRAMYSLLCLYSLLCYSLLCSHAQEPLIWYRYVAAEYGNVNIWNQTAEAACRCGLSLPTAWSKLNIRCSITYSMSQDR